MLQGATPARAAGALRDGCFTLGFVFTHTTSTGVVTMTHGQTGFSIGTFTAGVATLSFPKHFKFLSGFGYANTAGVAGASHELKVFGVDLEAGTATLRFQATDDGAIEDPGTETCYLTLFVGE